MEKLKNGDYEEDEEDEWVDSIEDGEESPEEDN